MSIQLSAAGPTSTLESSEGDTSYVHALEPRSLFSSPRMLLKSIDEDIGYDTRNASGPAEISSHVVDDGSDGDDCNDAFDAGVDDDELMDYGGGDIASPNPPPEDIAQSLTVEVVLIVDYTSLCVNFGNMRKTSIGKSAAVSGMVSDALRDAILEVRKITRHDKMFISTRELSIHQLHHRWIPSASDSIAKLLKTCLEYRDTYGGFFGSGRVDAVLDHYSSHFDSLSSADVSSRIQRSIRAMMRKGRRLEEEEEEEEDSD